MPIPKFTGKYCKNNCFFLTMGGQCVLYPSETYITHQIGLNNKRLVIYRKDLKEREEKYMMQRGINETKENREAC